MHLALPINSANVGHTNIDVDLGSEFDALGFRPMEAVPFDLAILKGPGGTNESLAPEADGAQVSHEAMNDFARAEVPSGSFNAYSAAGRKMKRKQKSPTKRDRDWKEVSGLLSELYPTEDLDVVMKEIKDKYGFEAT
jgi:hypothetical protein